MTTAPARLASFLRAVSARLPRRSLVGRRVDVFDGVCQDWKGIPVIQDDGNTLVVEIKLLGRTHRVRLERAHVRAV